MPWSWNAQPDDRSLDAVGLLGDEKASGEVDQSSRLKTASWLRLPGWVTHLLAAITGALLFAISAQGLQQISRANDRVDRFHVDHKDVFFKNDSRFVNDEIFTSKEAAALALHEWISLSSIDRGVVLIPPNQRTGLPSPVVFSRDRAPAQEVYFTSAFHQLHCLSSILQSYSSLRLNAISHERHGNGVSHITHCFDYLRQSIMCAGDTTLEGRTHDDEGGEVPIGWGSWHECRDWEQIKLWADERQPWHEPIYPDFL